MGSDLATQKAYSSSQNFNPRSPHGERLSVSSMLSTIYISIHAPRMGSDPADPDMCHRRLISIHAPRMGSDLVYRDAEECEYNFNPRSPHGERRRTWTLPRLTNGISIHAPRMGSDKSIVTSNRQVVNFNPRSPHGERHKLGSTSGVMLNFNPRSPHGERPRGYGAASCSHSISIHAPRMGSDCDISTATIYICNFNPRSPHGERLSRSMSTGVTIVFQSTLPAWGATSQ